MGNPEVLTTPSGLPLYYQGPSIDQGPLPAFFYFALSGHDSLHLDPFNQPAAFLENAPIRVFSSTLPLHDPEHKYTEAMAGWAGELINRHNIIDEFIFQCCENLEHLIHLGVIDETKIAAGGLSRGGFIATHFAAAAPKVSVVLGFAPMTKLDILQEFYSLPDLQTLNLESIVGKLVNKKVRLYIGNRDTRVGTEACFQFIQKLTEAAYQKRIRSPDAELILSPSVGHKGHGTPPHIFQDGVNWLKGVFSV